ncbi:MAG: saccharopine dehydrogenase family protein [Burkholderiales bacterium]
MVYGATGFTGRLISAAARAAGLDVIVAGRDRARLQALATSLDLPMRVVRLRDHAAFDRALADIHVLLNVAGPFAATTRPVLDACMRAKTHYLDVSGELPSFITSHEYDAAARDRNVMVMPGVGFVVTASDCLAAFVASRMPEARYLRLALSRTDLVSRGSYTTMLGLVRERVSIRREGRLRAVPVGQLERGFDYGEGERVSTAVSWADVFTAYHTTGVSNIEVYVEADAWRRWFYQSAAYFARSLNLGPVQKLLELGARAWPEGPSAEKRAAAPRVIVAEAEDRHRRCVRARLHTPDGYSFTPLSALAIAQRVLAGEFRAGFQTPAGVYGADFVLNFEGVRREDFAAFSEIPAPRSGANRGKASVVK